MRHPISSVLVLAALLSLAAAPVSAQSSASSSLRPWLDAGTSWLARFGDLDHSYLLGGGLETAISPRLAGLFQVDAHWLRGRARSVALPLSSGGGEALTGAAWTMSLGLRWYPRDAQRVRPYLDGCLGARVVTGSREGVVALQGGLLGRPEPGAFHDGATGAVRIGLSGAGMRGAGFFADAGYEVLLRNPRSFGMLPVRVGVML